MKQGRRAQKFINGHMSFEKCCIGGSRQHHGYHLQIAGLRWTSIRRSIGVYPSKNGRCSQIIENSQIGMSMYGHPGLLWERQFEKILLKYGWEKFPNWECLFVHRKKGLFLSVYVDDIKLAGKRQDIDPMWKVLNKEVIKENQHLSLIMYTWDALNDSAK